MTKHKTKISIGILILFHLIGVSRILLDVEASFLMLTPINLLLTTLIVLWNHTDSKGWWVFLTTYVLGLGIEIIGVQSAWPFGEYAYSEILGPRILDTPIIIGINWFILLYSSNSIASRVGSTIFTKTIVAATLMTLLDVLIEPVAIKLNFWTWVAPNVPYTNYMAWFGISAIISAMWQWRKLKLDTTIGSSVYLVQIFFFLSLTIFL